MISDFMSNVRKGMNSILQKRFVELDDNDNGSVVMLGRDTRH
jgi:hypothetical protein